MFYKLAQLRTHASKIPLLTILSLGALGLIMILSFNSKLIFAISDPISDPVSSPVSPSPSIDASPSASASATPSSSPSASPSILPSSSPSASASASPSPSASPTQMITFDDFNGQNTPVSGQYPQGMVDWGQNIWYVAGPVGDFDSKNIRFNDGRGRSEVFNFLSPKTILAFEVYNDASWPTFVYLSCRSRQFPFLNLVTQLVDPGEEMTVHTGWDVPCQTVKVYATRSQQTYFDNLSVK